jgi:exopolyphosphatase/guanosine-5'-triphosphate,3'-diphosphate pyrophosphatase
MTDGVVAAVDCGTNSTRLLVARGRPDGSLETLERLMTVTRLGAGVGRTGRLDPAAVERTLEVLRRYRDVLGVHGAESVRATATSAARDASNRDALLSPASDLLGTPIELLTGEEEGRLSFLGATAELDPEEGPFLVFDIGGGSTEYAVGTTEAEGVVTVDIGCVRLTEAYLEHDPPTAVELSSAISVVQAHLEDVARELPDAKAARTAIGLAGTVSTVAAVEIGLATYDRDRIHHFRLTRAAAEDVFRTLATEALVDRVRNPGLERARADVIVGGCCVLVATMRFFDLDEILVSEADILDGLARSLLA